MQHDNKNRVDRDNTSPPFLDAASVGVQACPEPDAGIAMPKRYG